MLLIEIESRNYALPEEPLQQLQRIQNWSQRRYRELLPDYLELAQSCTLPIRNCLAITHGVSGSGKSTIASALVASSGLAHCFR